VLSVKELTAYRGGKAVVEGVTLSASRELVLITGPNGAGKTTLLLAILGLVPHTGEVCVDGTCGAERVVKIGYVPQCITPEARATVWEYVYLPAKFRGVRDPEGASERALRAVGMRELRDAPVDSLSGGQLQRAAIARALATGGDVLLLDEPFANVDPQGRVELLSLLGELKRDRTVLVTTHELSLLLPIADRVMLLNRRVLAYGRPEEVVREEVLRSVYRYVRVGATPRGICCVTEDFAHPH